MNTAVNPNIKPGVYQGIPNDAYHAGPGISKSGLWELISKTPAHFKYAARDQKNHFDIGEAGHIAVLEPNRLEAAVYRGPDDRRGNKWKDAQEACNIDGKLCLTSSDYDKALKIRDTIHANKTLNSIITSEDAMIESSAYWVDPATGLLCRCRPDLWVPSRNLIIDLKTTASAQRRKFSTSIAEYGYHAQEAFYRSGMMANGHKIEGFLFLTIEKKDPFCWAIYEMKPSAVERGHSLMQEALAKYAKCATENKWAGYSEDVQEIDIPAWAYHDEPAPVFFDEVA